MKKPSRKNVKLSPDQQRALLQHFQSGPPFSLSALYRWAQAQFSLSKAPGSSTVSDLLVRWRKNPALAVEPEREDLLAKVSTVLDPQLMKWIIKCKTFCVCLTGHMIRCKAEKIRNELVLEDIPDLLRERLLLLKFSKGWLYNFQRRHNLISRRLHGEAGSVDAAAVAEGRNFMQGIAGLYEKQNVFNMDETAMYYCKAPDRTISPNAVPGRNKSKKRMTVAVTTNADGSEKLPLLFVGAARQPRCFQKKTPEQLGVKYSNTKKGWMTRALFREWMMELDAQMRAEDRHILLLLDNVPSHYATETLTNIRIEMLQPNMTSVLQPQDAGIIASLKAWIKRRQTEHVLTKVEEIMSRATDDSLDQTKKELRNIYNVDILEAMRWCNDAWDSVTQASVSNCWIHTSILPEVMYELMVCISSMHIEPMSLHNILN